MPRRAHNKMPAAVKKQYFELIREGYKGAAAARVVGVSTSCGSLWFLDAGGMLVPEAGPVSSRFLDQDDRIAIADGLSAGRAVKEIAAAIGKSFQTVYREVRRNSKPDGSYQPWWAHNQALQRRERPGAAKLGNGPGLSDVVRAKLASKWSPQQISRYLARSCPGQPAMQACAETIYRGLFAGVLGKKTGRLRTGRSRRKPHRRGAAVPNKIKNMTLLAQRPAEVTERRVPGHWEGDRATCKAARGELVIPFGGRIDEGVTRFSVCGTVPALACVTGDRGVRSPGKKPKPPSFHPGAAGEGKAGRVNGSESSYAS